MEIAQHTKTGQHAWIYRPNVKQLKNNFLMIVPKSDQKEEKQREGLSETEGLFTEERPGELF